MFDYLNISLSMYNKDTKCYKSINIGDTFKASYLFTDLPSVITDVIIDCNELVGDIEDLRFILEAFANSINSFDYWIDEDEKEIIIYIDDNKIVYNF